VTYDNNTLNVGTVGSLVFDQQTAGITNTLLLNKNLTVTNALTLGATNGTGFASCLESGSSCSKKGYATPAVLGYDAQALIVSPPR